MKPIAMKCTQKDWVKKVGCKRTKENIDVIHSWRKNTHKFYSDIIVGDYISKEGSWTHEVFPHGKYVKITYEQFLKYVLKQKTNMVEQLKLGQLKDLYLAFNCNDWQSRIKSYITDNILAKDDTLIIIKNDDITYARKNATAAQLDMLKNAGIKFASNCPYKDGDLLWVKNYSSWELRYSNGILNNDGYAICYNNQKKSGNTTNWGTPQISSRSYFTRLN